MKFHHTLIAGLLTATLLATPAFAQTDSPPSADAQSAPPSNTFIPQPGQHAYTFKSKLANGRNARLNYLLFLPASYGQEPQKKWPLLVFLHGSREVGRDIDRVKRAALPQIVEKNPDFPFIVVSPQAASRLYGWYPSLKTIEALLDELQPTLSIDPDRLYVTGLSMGGFGAWALAMDDPNRFAAIVPVVGGYFYNPKQLCELKDIPMWIFAARRDRSVPLRESERVVNALRACGGDPQFTVYEDANHDQGWQRAYEEPALYVWLQAQRRSGD